MALQKPENKGQRTLFTIGYAGVAQNVLIDELKKHDISCLIDVRSLPFSKQFPEYNRQMLEQVLPKNNIAYRLYADEFGARQNGAAFYSDESYLDFEKFAASEKFQAGIRKVLAGMKKGYSVSLLCAEHDPMECHRSILIARKFFELGYQIVHLTVGAPEQTQQDIETRLVDKFFPEKDQLLLFDNRSYRDLVQEAYRMQNKRIGYRRPETVLP